MYLVLAIGLIISLGGYIPKVGFIVTIFYIGYILALPIFLTWVQDNKLFNFKDILYAIWGATKKSLVSYILFVVIILILLFGLFILSLKYFGPTAIQNIFSNPQNIIGWNIPSFIFQSSIVFLFSFFSIFPIYYMIKKENFRKSIIKSVIFNLKHPLFFLFILMFDISNSFLNKFLYSFLNNTPVLLLQLLFSQVVTILTSAFCLLYFQKSEK